MAEKQQQSLKTSTNSIPMYNKQSEKRDTREGERGER